MKQDNLGPLFGEDETCDVGVWLAIGSVFTPFVIQHEGRLISGMRQLVCVDVTSHYIMDFASLTRRPSATVAADLLYFVTKVMTEQGMPRRGFLVLKSTYLSSNDLLKDETTAHQGSFLKTISASFLEMATRERATFRERMQTAELRVSFQGLPRIEADVTLAHREIAKQGQLGNWCNN